MAPWIMGNDDVTISQASWLPVALTVTIDSGGATDALPYSVSGSIIPDFTDFTDFTDCRYLTYSLLDSRCFVALLSARYGKGIGGKGLGI